MISIPGGSFVMGAPSSEQESTSDERPQHVVTVKPFLMGKYPVTQKQWRVVATFGQVIRELDPDPSEFKGDNLPVECISWDDANEFCARLTRKTKRDYRLPSEAEWEYAYRAGTTTPFHVGETITTDLVNYDGNYSYGDAPKGKYRERTTPVGNFLPNQFGLCDMHGNVWEWCADHWHSNYEGAPTDGSAWLSDKESSYRVWRGGSWLHTPPYCRSAFRFYLPRGDRNDYLGFRVSCSAARTLP
jgi:formylglycine-generating enzyme required for sulfatase activity